MLNRNSQKKYMLTAPDTAMRVILLKKMPPESIFIGDNLYQASLQAAEKNPDSLLEEFELELGEDETEELRKERLQKRSNELYKYYEIKEKIALLKSNSPRIQRNEDKQNKTYTIFNADKTPLVTFDQTNIVYQWIFTPAYRVVNLKLPYTLIDLKKLADATSLAKE